MNDVPLILVVEDEIVLHLALEDDLRGAGYDVAFAVNAARAQALIEKNERIKALVTDIRLGSGDNGWVLAQHAREKYPDIPVIYMSGDSASDWSAYGVPNSIMLAKPFASAQLVTAISHLLNTL
jgi:CheY-like chemotaxis protein